MADTKKLSLVDLVINDESVINDRGYNILNSALDRRRYDANPICLYMHNMESPIAICVALRIDGSKLIGSFDFDPEDPLAVEVHRKLSQGYLRGASPGLFIRHMTFTEDYASVDDWELVEVSVVSIPSNRNAVKLYGANHQPLSDEEATAYLETLRCNLNNTDMNNTPKTTVEDEAQPAEDVKLSAESYAALGVRTDCTVDELNAAISALADQNRKLQETLELARTTKRDALVANAIALGKITADKKQKYLDLYDKDPELCTSVLGELPNRKSLSKEVKPESPSRLSARLKGTWDELDRKGLLSELKAQDIETFKEKYFERFGVEYQD